jgi:two-component system sensor histidine kinase/response regulator
MSETTPRSPEPLVLDVDEALERLGGDSLLYAEVVDLFLKEAPRQIDSLMAHVGARRFGEVRTGAHCLKGAAAALGANRVMESARHLEFAAKDGQVDAMSDLVALLSSHFAEAQPALERVRAGV